MHRTVLFAFLVAQELTPQCGGSPSTTGPVPTVAPAANVQTLVVNAGPTNNYFNGAFTSVTICVPGQSTACQTIETYSRRSGMPSALTVPYSRRCSFTDV